MVKIEKRLGYMCAVLGMFPAFTAIPFGNEATAAESVRIACPAHWPGQSPKFAGFLRGFVREYPSENGPGGEEFRRGRHIVYPVLYRNIAITDPIYLICTYKNELALTFVLHGPMVACEVVVMYQPPRSKGANPGISAHCDVTADDSEALKRLRPYLLTPIDYATDIQGFRLRQTRESILRLAQEEGWVIESADASGVLVLRRGTRQIDVKLTPLSDLTREIIEYGPPVGPQDGGFFEGIVFRFGQSDFGGPDQHWTRPNGVEIRYRMGSYDFGRRQTFHLIDLKAE